MRKLDATSTAFAKAAQLEQHPALGIEQTHFVHVHREGFSLPGSRGGVWVTNNGGFLSSGFNNQNRFRPGRLVHLNRVTCTPHGPAF